jgi:hypothetical protein
MRRRSQTGSGKTQRQPRRCLRLLLDDRKRACEELRDLFSSSFAGFARNEAKSPTATMAARGVLWYGGPRRVETARRRHRQPPQSPSKPRAGSVRPSRLWSSASSTGRAPDRAGPQAAHAYGAQGRSSQLSGADSHPVSASVHRDYGTHGPGLLPRRCQPSASRKTEPSSEAM